MYQPTDLIHIILWNVGGWTVQNKDIIIIQTLQQTKDYEMY